MKWAIMFVRNFVVKPIRRHKYICLNQNFNIQQSELTFQSQLLASADFSEVWGVREVHLFRSLHILSHMVAWTHVSCFHKFIASLDFWNFDICILCLHARPCHRVAGKEKSSSFPRSLLPRLCHWFWRRGEQVFGKVWWQFSIRIAPLMVKYQGNQVPRSKIKK